MAINRRMLLQMIDKVVPRALVGIMGVLYRWDYSSHDGLFCPIVSWGCNRATDRYNLVHVSLIKMNNIRDYTKDNLLCSWSRAHTLYFYAHHRPKRQLRSVGWAWSGAHVWHSSVISKKIVPGVHGKHRFFGCDLEVSEGAASTSGLFSR